MSFEGRPNRFTLHRTDGLARRGQFMTDHGTFQTPNFMPVGTRASVKGVDVELVNTYHLWLRPGPSLVRSMGGIHRFCGWKGPILSDSGGFQIFSLEGMRKLSEEGVEFRSHLDGAKCFLTPELAIGIQEELGVDIAMVLDECPAGDRQFADVEQSLAMTNRWARRCLAARTNPATSVFGITQGGIFRELRTRAAEDLGALPFDGMAIGGLSVGESKEHMYEVLSYHPEQLPAHKIRYLMGVGTPEDIVEAVHQGVDLFDCVMPTRSGRFGRAFLHEGEPYLNIKNAKFSGVTEPLETGCPCPACRNYSKGYLHHLFKVGEMLGPQLLTIHNLTVYLTLMRRIREAIDGGRFDELHRTERARWAGVNLSA
jgi:queuine tRNA-ribosyltransferase